MAKKPKKMTTQEIYEAEFQHAQKVRREVLAYLTNALDDDGIEMPPPDRTEESMMDMAYRIFQLASFMDGDESDSGDYSWSLMEYCFDWACQMHAEMAVDMLRKSLSKSSRIDNLEADDFIRRRLARAVGSPFGLDDR